MPCSARHLCKLGQGTHLPGRAGQCRHHRDEGQIRPLTDFKDEQTQREQGWELVPDLVPHPKDNPVDKELSPLRV